MSDWMVKVQHFIMLKIAAFITQVRASSLRMVTCSTHVGCSHGTYSSVVERSIADLFLLVLIIVDALFCFLRCIRCAQSVHCFALSINIAWLAANCCILPCRGARDES